MTVAVITAVRPQSEAAVATALGGSGEISVVRRCPDLADLLAVAQAGRAQVAVVSPDLPGMQRSVLADLAAGGVAVVGVFDPYDETQERTLRQWRVSRIVSVHDIRGLVRQVAEAAEGATPRAEGAVVDPTTDDLDAELSALVTGDAGTQVRARLPGADPGGEVPEQDPGGPERAEPGRVITVWGPVGAPGRTTVAVNLAAELVLQGRTVLLVDADTYGACVGQLLALLDEAPGIAAATRLSESGRLDTLTLAAVAPMVQPGLRVLTGISRAARWPEIREDPLTDVLDTARAMVDLVVVDCAAPVEEDEELSYDTLAPRRNAATLAALRAADTVLAVGSADPVGLQRLVRGLEDARPVAKVEPRVVVTRLRASAVGSAPQTKVAEALARFAGVRELSTVPEDREAMDAALLAGQTLATAAAHSAAREAIAELAAEFSGVAHVSRRGRLRTLRPGSRGG